MFQLQAKSAIQKYIQEKSDIAIDKLNVKEYEDLFGPL